MITYEQAILAKIGDEIHTNGCTLDIGPRGGKTFHIYSWRVNGKVKTWKTRPRHFEVPIKHGFYGPYDYVGHYNGSYFHLAQDCPVYKSMD